MIAVQVILAGGEFGRPLVATPGTPPERLNILREAFAKSMKDPELLAEAKKARWMWILQPLKNLRP